MCKHGYLGMVRGLQNTSPRASGRGQAGLAEWPPRELTRHSPACASFTWPASIPASFSVPVGAQVTPLIKPWRASWYCQAAYCDSDKGMRPIGHNQRASPRKTPPG